MFPARSRKSMPFATLYAWACDDRLGANTAKSASFFNDFMRCIQGPISANSLGEGAGLISANTRIRFLPRQFKADIEGSLRLLTYLRDEYTGEIFHGYLLSQGVHHPPFELGLSGL